MVGCGSWGWVAGLVWNGEYTREVKKWPMVGKSVGCFMLLLLTLRAGKFGMLCASCDCCWGCDCCGVLPIECALLLLGIV